MGKLTYTYNNMPLSNYCTENDLNYNSIKTRIYHLKREYPDKTIEEIIELAINYKKKPNNKYYYQGIKLTDYCKANDLNASTIRDRIKVLSERNPQKTLDEIIEMAINFEPETNNIYFYEGICLTDYCKENNLNIDTIRSKMSKFREKYPKKTTDNIIKMAINDTSVPKNTKYFYKKKPLKTYCIENNLNYESIKSKITRLKKKYPNKKTAQIIRLALNDKKTTKNTKYFYKKKTLKTYCEENNLNYGTIKTRIGNLKREYPDKKINQIIKLAINYNKKTNNRYYYDGMTLTKYCEKNNISYKLIIDRIKKKRKKNPNLTDDELVFDALYKENELVKYYYKDKSLHEYCFINGYNYNAICSRIYRKINNNEEFNIESIVEDYEKDFYKHKFINIMSKEKYENNDEIKMSCDYIGVSYDDVINLYVNNYNIKDAIHIIYFFGTTNEKNIRTISLEKVNETKKQLDNIESLYETKEKMDENLLLFYKLYKCNLYDTRKIIIKDLNSNLYKIIYTTFEILNIPRKKENIDDVYNEMILKLYGILDRCYSLNKFQFLKFINENLKYYCMDYCKNNLLFNNISLDSILFGNKPVYNYIDSNNYEKDEILDFEISLDGYFCEEINKIIETLDKNSLKFIKLKYVYRYDNEFIASTLNLTAQEVIDLEQKILAYLRNDVNILTLKKEKR